MTCEAGMKSCSSNFDRLKSRPVSDHVVGVFYLRTIDPSSGIFPSEAVSIKMICRYSRWPRTGACRVRTSSGCWPLRSRVRTTTRTSISAPRGPRLRREAGYAHARQALERKPLGTRLRSPRRLRSGRNPIHARWLIGAALESRNVFCVRSTRTPRAAAPPSRAQVDHFSASARNRWLARSLLLSRDRNARPGVCFEPASIAIPPRREPAR
jgi:hypothetical protein